MNLPTPVLLPNFLSSIVSVLATVLGLPLLLVAAGCGGANMANTPAPTAPVVTISATPAAINAGSLATLTVSATGASSVTVQGTDGSSYAMAATGGTHAVNPSATTTYTATASGAGGTTSATTLVTVNGAPPAGAAPTVTITATPTSVNPGSASTLAVEATNATKVTISGTDGSSYTLQANGGTQLVTPTATTTYTAEADGAGGQAKAPVTVTVNAVTVPPPTVNLAANPTSITVGAQTTLTVSATNATTLTLAGSDGTTYQIAATGGTQVVTPAASTTYTATATNLSGSVTATATVTVTAVAAPPPPPSPTVSLSANPASITAGSTSTLNVAATNATTLTVTGSDGTSYPIPVSGSIFSVTPSTTTTYTATATGAGGSASATAIVTVTPKPAATVTISATPTSITSGSTATLTVTATNDSAVSITGSDGTSYPLASAGGGQQTVSPTATTIYTATATGATGNVTATTTVKVTANPLPTVTITANPVSVVVGNASTLTVTAANDTSVTVSGSDGTSYTTLPAAGGTLTVTPTTTTTYTANATGAGGAVSAGTTVTVTAAGNVKSIDHVIFMMQENHSFDNYFGMLNPYRQAHGFTKGDDNVTYNVDGIEDKLGTISNKDDEGDTYPLFKLKSTCVDDETSAWLGSYGDINRYNFTATRPILMDGFVHNGEGFAKSCVASGSCSGTFSDTTGQRVMGYYDEGFLNYYYYMASQFALSNRWFSPVSSKSISNRVATFTGGTTQGLVNDPGNDDHLPQLNMNNIFQALDTAKVSWKIYYTVSTGLCLSADDCSANANPYYPATDFSNLSYSYQYLYQNPTHAACTGTTTGSKAALGDPTDAFCVDTNHIAQISQYTKDLQNGTLPSFAFIEAGYGNNDEHPGSGQSVLSGQAQVASLVNALMASSSWKDSVFFLTYDEGGGPYDHVPPVPGHSNDKTNITALGVTPPDIASIAVNPDSYLPCQPAGAATINCDLHPGDPGTNANDAVSQQGFAAQLGFRVPNMIISPFTKKHYVSNTPMDHTAIIKFVEDRFIGNGTYLTNRDKAQPDLLEFFDFSGSPWSTPPPTPAPVTAATLGYDPCTPASMGP